MTGSGHLDKFLLMALGMALCWRIFCEKFLQGFGPLGSNKLGNLSMSAIILLITTIYLIKRTCLKEGIILPKACWAMMVFGLICSVSVCYSVDVPGSLHAVVFLWSFIFLVMMLVNILGSLENIKIIIYFLMLIAGIASMEALYEYFFQLPWYLSHTTPQMLVGHRDLVQLLRTHRTPTLFFWPNSLSGFLIMVLPMTIGFAFIAKESFSRIRLTFLSLIIVAALYLELTISCWIGLLLACLLMLFLTRRRFSKTNLRLWLGVGILILVMLSMVVIVKKLGFSQSNSFSSRLVFVSDAAALIMKHPIVGNGWNSFGIASAPYANGIDQWANYAHNSYLQIFSETGLLGILSFIVFLFFLGKAMGTLKNQEHPLQLVILGVLIGALACLVDNCFSYTMLLPNTAIYWWVMVAVVLALYEYFRPTSNGWMSFLNARMVLIAANVFLFVFSWRLMQAEYDYFTALPFIHQSAHEESAIALFKKGSKLNPWDKKFELAEAVAYEELFYRTQNRDYLTTARQLVSQTMGQASLGQERQALMNRLSQQV